MTGGIFRAVRLLQQCRNARSRSASLARPYTRSLQSKVPRRFQSTGSQYDPKIFRVSEEVQEAIATGKPVVALETTIYTHGFPYPDNVALATHLESVVRRNGGVPATIGVLDGVARVGLNEEEVIQIASAAGKPETMKVSRRDIPFITGLGLSGRKLNGGTTVAGTMVLAKMAGIEVFGTGGLGGVHRGGEDSMDISADLTELGRTGVAVISSGCKSFLDIPRTLEYLETQGVTVATFADERTGNIDLPAFWTRDSGIRSPTVVQNEKEAAAIIYARRLLEVESGLLFANPIPEEHSIPGSEINSVIEEAVREAAEKGFHGHANTPFILAKIKELTGGKSIPANTALIESNVMRATRVAVELALLGKEGGKSDQISFMPAISSSTPLRPEKTAPKAPIAPQTQQKVDILVAGSIAVDLACDFSPFTNASSSPSPILNTSNPARIAQSIGGVGHNVATAAHLLSPPNTVRLCSLVADDLAGNLILSTLAGRGLDTSGIITLESNSKDSDQQWRTAQYVAVNDAKKDLVVAMADMDIIGSPAHNPSTLWPDLLATVQPSWVVVDGNWDVSVLQQWLSSSKQTSSQTVFEPVSVAKSTRLFPSTTQVDGVSNNIFPSHAITLTTPNEHELIAMHAAAKENRYFESQEWWLVIDALGIPSSGARAKFVVMTSKKLVDEGIPQRVIQLLPLVPNILTKLGAEGVLVTKLLPTNSPILSDPKQAPYILSRCNTDSETVGGVYMRLYPAAERVPDEDTVSVNGVGDTFLGAVVAGLARGMELDERLVGFAQKAAVMTLKSPEAVSPHLGELKGLLG